jgi:hypothetical protein
VFQLILMEVRPPPDTCVDHVGESFPTSNLQTCTLYISQLISQPHSPTILFS